MIARFPISGCAYTVQKGTIMQHWKVKAGPVPADYLRSKTVYPVKEALD